MLEAQLATRELNKELKSKLNTLAIISNENRFSILLALLTSSVLKFGKHSHTFKELGQIANLKTPDLSYHLHLLRDVDLVDKKEYPEVDGKSTYYNISEKGKKILKNIGVTPKIIKDTKKKVSR